MSMHLHVPLNSYIEHIFVFPPQITAKRTSITDDDLGSRPLVDVLDLELQGVGICMPHCCHQETGQQHQQLQSKHLRKYFTDSDH